MAVLPALASWAGTPQRPSAAVLRVPDGEKPVTFAHLRAQVRLQGRQRPFGSVCSVAPNRGKEPGVMTHACNPGTWVGGTERSGV